MIPSSKSLCYISVITLGASRLASAGLEHVIGDSEITTKQALTRHSPHDLNPALGNVAAEEVGKGYGHNRQIGLKACRKVYREASQDEFDKIGLGYY
ncbi:hypothetical protein H4Q26_012871 [Puccinia striiformis f. sp. tritici PST-130]|nr:hypothetical protein H4Q26_012871 [Puccinia striiformis f. sp. tritici PST-130]